MSDKIVDNEKKLLVECITFESDPSLLKESVDNPNRPFKVKGILQRKGRKNQNGRIYPDDVLEREVDKYAKTFVADRRALGELDHPETCLSKCDILTEDGWKDIKDISDSEKIFTLNRETGYSEIHTIDKKIDEYYKGTLYHIKNKNIDIEATANHRFIVKDRTGKSFFITAKELYDLSKDGKTTHLSIPKTAIWKEDEINSYKDKYFNIDPVEFIHGEKENRKKQNEPLKLDIRSWFGFLGFYLAEGHINNRENSDGYRVFITQNEGKIADNFRNLLKSLSDELTWNECHEKNRIIFYTSDARLWTYLSKLGNKYTKYIPIEIKKYNPVLLKELFDWFSYGDGTIINDNGYDRQSVFSVSKKLIEDLQEILFKIGMCGRIKIQESSKDYIYANHLIESSNKLPLYRLFIDKSNDIYIDFRFLSITPIEYEGHIYCVSVKNETFYCRNEGKCFWSGNSVVNLKNVSHNVIELYWNGNDLIGIVEVLTTPNGNILRELFRNGIKLGISSRGLGSLKKIDEHSAIVGDDFELVSFDFVSNPSTQGAFMSPMNQTPLSENIVKNPVTNKWEKVNNIIRNILLELS